MKSWLVLGSLYLLVPNALVHYFCLPRGCNIRVFLAVAICASHAGFDIWLYCLLKIILLHFAALVTSTKTLYNSLSAIKGDCNVYVLDMYMYLIALYQQSLIIKADAT